MNIIKIEMAPDFKKTSRLQYEADKRGLSQEETWSEIQQEQDEKYYNKNGYLEGVSPPSNLCASFIHWNSEPEIGEYGFRDSPIPKVRRNTGTTATP